MAARHIAPCCETYTGVDAVASADAAQCAVPLGRFEQIFLPCPLPEGAYDLILLSEVLYFLDASGLVSLARQIAHRWPDAEVLTVTWLGPSGNPLEGLEAFSVFAAAIVQLSFPL